MRSESFLSKRPDENSILVFAVYKLRVPCPMSLSRYIAYITGQNISIHQKTTMVMLAKTVLCKAKRICMLVVVSKGYGISKV